MIGSNSLQAPQRAASFNLAVTRGDTTNLHAPVAAGRALSQHLAVDPRAGLLQSRYLGSASSGYAPASAFHGTGISLLADHARGYYLSLGTPVFSAPAAQLSPAELHRRDEVLGKLQSRLAAYSSSGAVTPHQTTTLGGLLAAIYAKNSMLRAQHTQSTEVLSSPAFGADGVHRFYTRNNSAFGGRFAKSEAWLQPRKSPFGGVESADEATTLKSKAGAVRSELETLSRQTEVEDSPLRKPVQSSAGDATEARRASTEVEKTKLKETGQNETAPKGVQQPDTDSDAARPKVELPKHAPRADQGEEARSKPPQSAPAAAESEEQARGPRVAVGDDEPQRNPMRGSDDAPPNRPGQATGDTDSTRPAAVDGDSTYRKGTGKTQAGRGQGSVTGYGIGETTSSSDNAAWKKGTYNQGENSQSFAEVAAGETRSRTFKTELGVGAQAEANAFRASAGVSGDRGLVTVGDAEMIGVSGNAEAHLSVGARGTAEAGVGIGKDGLPALRVGADAYAGVLQENRTGGEVRLMGVGVGAQGSTQLMAGAQANAEATLGVTGGRVSTGAFAGASAGTSGTVNVAGVGASGSAEAWAGIGAKADADVGYKEGKLNFELGIGAALGVGGATSVGFTWDLNKTVTDGKRFVDNVGNLIDGTATTTAKTLGTSAKDVGQAATVAAKNVEQGAKSATKSVAKAASSAGKSISKGLKKLFRW